MGANVGISILTGLTVAALIYLFARASALESDALKMAVWTFIGATLIALFLGGAGSECSGTTNRVC
jgi:RsiW-degrading membrane proteinase PrsW (M82 family)